MDSAPFSFSPSAEQLVKNQAVLTSTGRIIEFYEAAGLDYRHWSKGLNMHLGFYRWGTNPFNREQMFEQLNLEIAERLRLNFDDAAFLVDLGCGMGATARTIARRYPAAVIKGVTLAPSQVRIATEENMRNGLEKRIEILENDFTKLPFADNSVNGVWAVESSCYAHGSAKEDLIREMARVLSTGGRFVVADSFVKNPDRKFNFLTEKSYLAACKNWEVPEMPTLEDFVAALKTHGFRDVIVEDISWRAAPSVAHAPFAVATFFLKKFLAGEPLKRHSINNLKASLLALVIGASRSKFSYCIISGTRGQCAVSSVIRSHETIHRKSIL
jgi:MPBQ/MSBQ methyltransferase